jgi:hypothetical protein
MQTFKKFFLFPTLITIFSLIMVQYFGGLAALFSVLVLIVLEVTLSFDNAVVNAKVLEGMSPVWRQRFITWGIWLAVFGTRVVLPIFIVSLVSGLSVLKVLNLAIFDPSSYGMELDKAHYSIGAFGGIFLLLVALKYFIDDNKDIHWIHRLEVWMKRSSSVESVEIVFALSVLVLISYFVPLHATEILFSGIIGTILFVLIQGVTNSMDKGLDKIAAGGFGLFMYLNLLDAAFSLDGVIGAFAISSNLLVIAVGLGVGAYFVRIFTLMMVEKKTLKELRYLEHGAHWAIGGLGLCMLFGLLVHIPEVLTGVIGLIFVAASYYSSVKK